jgi:hypothetical protein
MNEHYHVNVEAKQQPPLGAGLVKSAPTKFGHMRGFRPLVYSLQSGTCG